MARRASWATFAGEASSWSERRVSTHMASALWCWCESGIKLESRSIGLPVTIAKMNWNDAAEDLLQQILAQTPRPVREAAETDLERDQTGVAKHRLACYYSENELERRRRGLAATDTGSNAPPGERGSGDGASRERRASGR